MTRFISLHSPNGKEVRVKADIIIGLQCVDAESSSGSKVLVTMILTRFLQLPVKESIEQIEAILSEPDYSA